MDNETPANTTAKMNIWSLLRKILPYVLPYRWLIGITLVLTLVGSLMSQVNAVVLDRAVDAINALIRQPGGFAWGAAARILTVISIILQRQNQGFQNTVQRSRRHQVLYVQTGDTLFLISPALPTG